MTAHTIYGWALVLGALAFWGGVWWLAILGATKVKGEEWK